MTKQEQRNQERLAHVQSTLKFHEDVFVGLYATCHSTTEKTGVYVIDLDEKRLYATACSCPSKIDCIHMLGFDRYCDAYRPTFKQQCNGIVASRETIDRLLGVETVGSIGSVMCEAAEAMTASIEEAAQAGDKSYTEALEAQIGEAYEQLGAMKLVAKYRQGDTEYEVTCLDNKTVTEKLTRQQYEAVFDPNNLQ